MKRHFLSLDIPETMNDCALIINDSSIYEERLPTDCPTLEIHVPGFSHIVTINNLQPGFQNLVLSACDLEIQFKKCGFEFNSLPDGIYTIRYSVAPNISVFVEYNHFRINEAKFKYESLLCDMSLRAIEPSPEDKSRLDSINTYYNMIIAAKAMAEVCNKPDQAIELYNYGMKKLSKLDCKTCK